MRHFILLSVICCLLSSCGKKDGASNSPGSNPQTQVPSTPGTTSPSIPSIIYDSSVSASDKTLIEQDLNTINELNITTKNYAYILGIEDFSVTSLKKWLTERTKFIVGQTYEHKTLAKPIQEGKSYSPSLIADMLNAEAPKVYTLMSNAGAEIYLNGKDTNIVYSLPINGVQIPIKSPRVGIVKIGEGHFSVNKVSGSDLSSKANRLLRLSVLFHESRHTDGNGSNAAFPHLKCTEGDYKNSYACEGNTNGPYMVEWVLLKHFYDQCTNCTSSELATLQLKIEDKLSRLVSGYKMSDAKPEAIQ